MADAQKDYLSAFDAADEADRYPLVQGWIKSEPLAFYKQLRRERPVLETPDCTFVARFADVRDMLQMPKIFTVDLYKPKMGVTGPDDGFLMAHDDDALHYREKSLMQGLLNRNDLPRVRQMVSEAARQTLEEARGKLELVNGYCRVVPVHLVQEYFGLDDIDRQDLIRWSYWNQYDAFNNQPFDLLSDSERREITERHGQASQELVAYLRSLLVRKSARVRIEGVASRVVTPIRKPFRRLLEREEEAPRQDDMVQRMLASEFADTVEFPLTRVGVNAGGLLIGAIETTSQAVAQVMEYLIDRPDLLRQAKEKARLEDTRELDAVVWEALRFVPIRSDIFRQAASDYSIAKGTGHETEIKAGTIVRLLIHSAMFDDYAYHDPDDFNPDRTFYHNFVFGYGPHECLGKYVGMEMIPEMVRQAVLLDGLGSNGPINYRSMEFPDRDGPFPESYDVTWSDSAEGISGPD